MNLFRFKDETSPRFSTMKNAVSIAIAAIFFATVGVALYRFQGPGEPVMNPLGVVSFGSLGACLGCLVTKPSSAR